MAHQKIIYQLTDKRIPAASGIGIVGDILERAGFSERFRDVKLAEKRSKKQIDVGAVMKTFIALLCMGKPDFECVREFQNDAAYYQNALHLNKGFPSSATLRQRMDEIGSKLRTRLLDISACSIRNSIFSDQNQKIRRVNQDAHLVNTVAFSNYNQTDNIIISGNSIEAEDNVFYIFAVCDGIGGGFNGGYASSYVVEHLNEIRKKSQKLEEKYSLDSDVLCRCQRTLDEIRKRE